MAIATHEKYCIWWSLGEIKFDLTLIKIKYPLELYIDFMLHVWGFFFLYAELFYVNTCSHHKNTPNRLYNFDPLEPHFYIVKLGFTGVCIIFLISAQNIDCGYSLEPPQWGGSNDYPQSMFWVEIWKISDFFLWKFSFFGGKIFSTFE